MKTRPLTQFSIAFTAVFLMSLVGLWAWAIYGRAWFMPPEYGMWVAKEQMLSHCYGGKIIILGDSQPNGDLVPDVMGSDVVNLAVSSTRPIDVYYFFQKLARCDEMPRLVVLSFVSYAYTESSHYWDRSGLFGQLSFEEMEEVRTAAAEIDDVSAYKHPDRFGRLQNIAANWVYRVRFPSLYMGSMQSAVLFFRHKQIMQMRDETLEQRGYHSYGRDDRAPFAAHYSSEPNFIENPLEDLYFERLLSLLQDRKVPVFYLQQPISSLTKNRLSERYTQSFSSYLTSRLARHPNVVMVGSSEQVLPDTDFGDEHHLNPQGARKWSMTVANLLGLHPPRNPE